MNKENITRYVRPEDIPSLDKSIVEPVLASVSKEMAVEYPEFNEAEWMEKIYMSLVSGELLLVIDDHHQRLGLVRTDEPPFDAIVRGDFDHWLPGVEAADPLGIKRQFGSTSEHSSEN